MNAVGGNTVQVEHTPAAPVAGRHDRRRQRHGFPLPLVAYGHVHQEGQPEPSRVRPEYVRDGRADQAVDEDDGIVWQRPQLAGEVGALGSAGPRPRTPDRVLAHRPARRGEAGADPAVVHIAAARVHRIVDVVRHDEVDDSHIVRS
jgi:hypothetical protein